MVSASVMNKRNANFILNVRKMEKDSGAAMANVLTLNQNQTLWLLVLMTLSVLRT